MKAQPGSLPRLVQAPRAGVSLLDWVRERRYDLDGELDTAGALLFRGFAVGGADGFRAFVDAVSAKGPLDYMYGSTPRTAVGGGVYTATEYPASQTIPLHNECAYQRTWPMRLFFLSVTPAKTGGETPIADTVRITARIDAGIRERFRRHGVLYVRNYRKGLDVPWQTVFQTDDRAAVERFCADEGIDVEWRPNDALRTKQVCQAFATHPRTGQEVWMNQAHLFHVTSLEPRVRENLLRMCAEDELPRNTYYGDGTPLELDVLEHVREAFRSEEVAFPWQADDVLVVDNMLVSHGRRPFSGERRVLVAMSQSYSPARDAAAESRAANASASRRR
jgi:alpha-ketoglutarate-dependent taurine dioxygenase